MWKSIVVKHLLVVREVWVLLKVMWVFCEGCEGKMCVVLSEVAVEDVLVNDLRSGREG